MNEPQLWLQQQEQLAVWGGWTLGDHIKQPIIRHSFVHLDEARTIKQKTIGETDL